MESGLYNIDCNEFLLEKEKFIDLVVTSPPYNVNVEYDVYKDKKPYTEYLNLLARTFKMIYNCMKDNRVICVNIGKNYAINTPAHISNILQSVGFSFYCSIVWKKPIGSAIPSAMCKEGFPKYIPYCITEDILIFTKGKMRNFEPDKEIMKARREYLSNVWEILPVFSKQHPAIMPRRLAYNLIIFFSKKYDIVFDPFAGIGTTLAVAKEHKRGYNGCELSKEYCRIADLQLRQELLF